MSAKKTICMLSAGAMLAAAVPAFADHDRYSGHRYRGYDHVPVQPPVTVERRVERTVVRERPVYQQQPVYDGYGHPAYRGRSVYSEPVYSGPVYSEPYYHAAPAYGPAPYYVERRDNTAAILGGAALGAALGSQVGDRHSRPAAMAIGAVFGAILGNELSDR